MKKLLILGCMGTTIMLMPSCKKELTSQPEVRQHRVAAYVPKMQKGALIYSGGGDIVPAMGAFIDNLGTTLNTQPDGFPSGFRMVNWADYPLMPNAGNSFPGNYFNNTNPQAFASTKRGVVFTTPGTGFMVSDNRFEELDPAFAQVFNPYTTTRAFSPVGSNITEVHFKVPGTNIPAYVHGFGLILVDADNGSATTVEYFSGEESLGIYMALPGQRSGQSFLGVRYPNKKITRVRITCGSAILAPGAIDGGASDLVVMDDMMYDEPKAL